MHGDLAFVVCVLSKNPFLMSGSNSYYNYVGMMEMPFKVSVTAQADIGLYCWLLEKFLFHNLFNLPLTQSG